MAWTGPTIFRNVLTGAATNNVNEGRLTSVRPVHPLTLAPAVPQRSGAHHRLNAARASYIARHGGQAPNRVVAGHEVLRQLYTDISAAGAMEASQSGALMYMGMRVDCSDMLGPDELLVIHEPDACTYTMSATPSTHDTVTLSYPPPHPRPLRAISLSEDV